MMKPVHVAVLILLGFICSAVAAVELAPYLLGPTDIIAVRVQRHDEFSGVFLIPPDGSVTFPAVGTLLVTGKTLPEIEEALRAKLSTRLQRPEVSVTLHTRRSQHVYILGAVAKPGMYALGTGWRIAELIAVAGGLSAEQSDCTAVLLHGGSARQESIDLTAVLKIDTRANLPLTANDVLSIQATEQYAVYVIGAVSKPGMYPLKAGARITELVALAGGLTADAKACTAAVLRKKDGQRVSVTLAAAINMEPNANLALEHGDVLLVDPPQLLPICMSGLVKTPGQYLATLGDSVTQAVALAGGLTIPEAEARISILRGGQKITLPAYASMLAAGDGSATALLQRGDTVEVTDARLVQVTVTGEVKEPGIYYLKPSDSLLHVIAHAGGVLESAALNRITIRRLDGQSVAVDLSAAVKQGKIENVPAPVNGDLIVVPSIADRFIIFGGVKTPGYYPLPPHQPVTLSEALALAGGMTVRQGNLRRVAILRSSAPAKQQRVIVDYARFLKTGDSQSNPMLAAGDVVYVPEGTTINWSMVLSAVSTFAVLNSSL
ncbi:MAG: SLBB domain-containing protein [Armatimonadota bacterium]